MKDSITQSYFACYAKAAIAVYLMLMVSESVNSQVNSLPFNEAFSSAFSSDFYSVSGVSANQGSTDACTAGNFVGVVTSSEAYLVTKTYSVPQGDGLSISFTLKNGGSSFTAPDVYVRVNDAITFNPFDLTDNGWVKVGSGTNAGSSCSSNTITVGNDIVGGQRVCVAIYFSSASSANFISIDNLSLTAVAGSAVQTTYTEDFTSGVWYNSPGYAKIPYHSSSSSGNSYVYLFNGGVGGFSDYYAALYPGFDPNLTNMITEEVNTSAYSKGELRYNFTAQYPCGGPNNYTYNEDYSSFVPTVYIMQGADNGTNTWTQLDVNSYFPDNTWRYVAVDISAYKTSNIKIMFEAGGFCSNPLNGIDNIQILDRDCSISKLTCGAITGTTSPAANTNYNYSVPAITGAAYYMWYVRNGGTLYNATPYIVSGQGTQNVTINFGSLASPLRVICIPYDANPTSNANACYAQLGYVDMASCTAPVISSADSTEPGSCGSSDGSIELNGLTASAIYSVTYNYNGVPVSSFNDTASAGGVLTIANLSAGSYNNFVVSLAGCSSSAFPATGAVTISNPTGAGVGTPVFNLGSTSSRCQGAGMVTYTATAANNTGITYSLDATSLTAGNTINSTTGLVTYTAGYTGTAVITAMATGCGGPLTATHTVTISANTGTPVFNMGASSSRCAGAGTVTYTATATGSTNIAYSLDATSLTAGNTINSATGEVTYTAGYSGTAIITATATGCGSPAVAMHTVTISPAVSSPVFNMGSSSSRCEGVGAVTYSATAADSTGISYSLDATSLTAGNSINSATGAVTYVSNYSGTTVITATASGCGGPLTATHTVTISANVGVPNFNMGATSNRCVGTGTVAYTATAAGSTNITYSLDAASLTAGNTINSATGAVTYTNVYTGTSVITATATGCSGPTTSTHTVTITANVSVPVFNLGATSSRCEGAGTVTYTATGSNNTGITYSLDGTSLTAGNIINSTTGAVVYTSVYSGTAVITAIATGCGGPVTAMHTVTINAQVASPVFNNGLAPTRCVGAGVVTYTATAANDSSISYSLDATSLLAGNAINSATGAVTYTANYTGTSVITAIATGCGGPLSTAYTVTISPDVAAPVFNIGATSNRCEGSGTVTYTATATNSTGITYSLDATSLGAGNTINSNNGDVTYTNVYTGTAIITASAAGCAGPVTSMHTVTISANLGTPVFDMGATSSRCVGTGSVTYTATAANSTGITYSLDVTSLTAGLTINSSTGAVTYTSGYTGTATITATATGCGSPLTATHTVTISPDAATPVFDLGTTSSRCVGTGTVTYTATAANSTGLTYSLDATSLGAGNTINSSTGAVTYTSNYTGMAVITASAAGCGGPITSTHTVTISANTGTPVFTLGSASNRCIGTGTITYTATAAGSTNIVYSLDATSITAGNTINSVTGAVTYTAGYAGTAVITATASGCGNPAMADHTVTISPDVTTPVFVMGSSSVRCEGTGAITYTATATNSTGITYSLDATSLAAGITINSATGMVNYTNAYNGTAIITASAAGCGGPLTTEHTVTITPSVSAPVFNNNNSPTRCEGPGTVVYAATAVNDSSLLYSLDAASLTAGNAIDSLTGAVTYAPAYTGVAVITATATGCGGPVAATYMVTVSRSITPTIQLAVRPGDTICAGETVTFTAVASNEGTTPVYQWFKNSDPVGQNLSFYSDGGLQRGDAVTCMLTSDAACASPANVTSSPVTMFVNVTPGPPAASSNSPLCQGEVLQLNCPQTNGAAYSWTGPNNYSSSVQNPVINDAGPANSGLYAIALTVSGCTGSPDSLNVMVNPTPAVPSITQSHDTLTSSVATKYQWYFQDTAIDGATQRTYVFDRSGIYTVQVTDANGCQATSQQFGVKLTGVDDIFNDSFFTMYPNPASGIVELRVSSDWIGQEVEIINMSGQNILKFKISSEKDPINISFLPAGIYLVKAGMLAQRLVKE